ncbi:MAG TPA: PKD domain-containing protein, partial [Fibrobacteria bacterium]|nr:PKD domain-containing protein [Fibrobacteria bacterium]
MKRRALLFPALVLALLWACHLSPEDSRDTIAVDADSTWTSYSRIRIDMLDSSGSVLATLFDDTLRSPDQLRNLSAEKYAGGDIRILIVGYIGDTPVFEQSRLWVAQSGKVKVDTVKDPWVQPRGVVLSPAELALWLGGADTVVEARIEPAYADQNLVFTVEDEGTLSLAPDTTRPGRAVRLKPIRTGEARIKAASAKDASMFAVLSVKVKQDAPRLAISASASETAIDHPVVYACTTRQDYGSITSFAWDLDGDGAWDDSLAGDWPGTEAVLPARSTRYAREGRVMPRFRVLDTEGNVAETTVSVDVRNDAPEIRGIRKDTVISIRDSVPMFAIAEDRGGGIRWVGWDFDGDGTFDDTAVAADSVVEMHTGYRYPEAGEYEVGLEVRDVQGKPTRASFKVSVERDPPVADAGRDTTVVVGTAMRIRAGGSDKHGIIVKREVRVGAAFVTLSKPDTTLRAPSEPAVLEYVIRVTDDDELSDEDTVLVTV